MGDGGVSTESEIGIPKIESYEGINKQEIIEVYKHASGTFKKYFGEEFKPGQVRKITVIERSRTGTTSIFGLLNLPDIEGGYWKPREREVLVSRQTSLLEYPDWNSNRYMRDWVRAIFHELGHAYFAQLTGNNLVEGKANTMALEAAAELGRVVSERRGEEQDIIDTFALVFEHYRPTYSLFSREDIRALTGYYSVKRFNDAAVLHYVLREHGLQTIVDLVTHCPKQPSKLRLKLEALMGRTSPQVSVKKRRQEFDDWVQGKFGQSPESLSKKAFEWYKQKSSHRRVHEIPQFGLDNKSLEEVV